MSRQPNRDQAKLWREPSLGGVDLLRAHFETHAFMRHAHDEYVVAVFEEGAEQFEAGGSRKIAGAGSVLVIPPGLPHTGSSATPAGWTYRAFYPRRETLIEVLPEAMQKCGSRPFEVRLCQIQNRELHAALAAAHRSLEAKTPLLERQSILMSAFSCLLRRLNIFDVLPAPSEAPAVRRTKEYLEGYFADQIGIDELAYAAGLSASHLMRSFRRQVGIPIHAYLTRVRLRHAREMLVRGEPAAEVATAVGFVDQSHLIRHFRHAYGATPGSYARHSALAVR